MKSNSASSDAPPVSDPSDPMLASRRPCRSEPGSGGRGPLAQAQQLHYVFQWHEPNGFNFFLNKSSRSAAAATALSRLRESESWPGS